MQVPQFTLLMPFTDSFTLAGCRTAAPQTATAMGTPRVTCSKQGGMMKTSFSEGCNDKRPLLDTHALQDAPQIMV